MQAWIIIGVVLVILVFGGRAVAKSIDYDRLFREAADRFGVDPVLLKAIAYHESGLNARAYNPEGFNPPPGRPRLTSPIPEDADVSGYQGSFGLAQIYHSDGYSTARVLRPSGAYPGDLLIPAVNIEVEARFLRELKSKGYGLEEIDVYNIGETKYRQGVRNLAYLAAVKAAYRRFEGDF